MTSEGVLVLKKGTSTDALKPRYCQCVPHTHTLSFLFAKSVDMICNHSSPQCSCEGWYTLYIPNRTNSFPVLLGMQIVVLEVEQLLLIMMMMIAVVEPY